MSTIWRQWQAAEQQSSDRGSNDGDDERKFALATTFHFILLTGMLKAKKTERGGGARDAS